MYYPPSVFDQMLERNIMSRMHLIVKSHVLELFGGGWCHADFE